MMKWIRGGTIITATEIFVGELLAKDGEIVALGKDLRALTSGAVEEIDAGGLYVFPGAIDAHTHFDLPFMGTASSDDFKTGTLAAAAGGTTSVIDFAIQSRGRPLAEAVSQWHEKAAGKAAIDYGFHLAVTDYNESVEAELPKIIEQGITSFKCFTAYKNALMIDDGQLFNVMNRMKALGGMVSLHAEHGDLIDVLAKRYLMAGKTDPVFHELAHTAIGEGEATHRAIALSRIAGVPVYIVHLTCNEALQAIKDSVSRYRHPVLAETCPQYLLLDREVYEKADFEGAKYVMSPPIRTRADQEALWAGLRDGFLQVVATDHCPFFFKGQKEKGRGDFSKIPNGGPGVEDRFKLMYTYGVDKGRISLNRFVQVMCSNPARIFGMSKKGNLTPGCDADIVLFDPLTKGVISAKSHHHNCDYSLFEGYETKGEIVGVLSRGDWVVKDKKVVGAPGRGKYVPRTKFDPMTGYVR
ncbi:dihydropyrimidinase [Bdellovibrionota bacterium FG-2]